MSLLTLHLCCHCQNTSTAFSCAVFVTRLFCPTCSWQQGRNGVSSHSIKLVLSSYRAAPMVTAPGEKWLFFLMTNICGKCWCPSCFLECWAKDASWPCVGYSLPLAVRYPQLVLLQSRRFYPQRRFLSSTAVKYLDLG